MEYRTPACAARWTISSNSVPSKAAVISASSPMSARWTRRRPPAIRSIRRSARPLARPIIIVEIVDADHVVAAREQARCGMHADKARDG